MSIVQRPWGLADHGALPADLGVEALTGDTADDEDALVRADTAMYQPKANR
jgi:GGDEF domain-containing protein